MSSSGCENGLARIKSPSAYFTFFFLLLPILTFVSQRNADNGHLLREVHSAFQGVLKLLTFRSTGSFSALLNLFYGSKAENVA